MNLQNIPSHNKDIRKAFVASNSENLVMESDHSFTVGRWCEVNTVNGFVCADKIQVGDTLVVTDNGISEQIIVSKVVVGNNHIIYYYN